MPIPCSERGRTPRSRAARIGLACLLVTCATAAAAEPAGSAPLKPNIVVIVTDDQDVGSIELMPQLQSLLAAQGTRFDNAFVTTSMCCPSRASILRGQYAHNHGVWRNLPSNGGGFPRFQGLGLEKSTIATWLQGAGYHTALVGKYINAYPASQGPHYVPPGWDDWYAPISPFDLTYFDFSINANGEIVDVPAADGYRTDFETALATDLIRDSPRPFFLYVSPWASHKEIGPQGASPPVSAPRHAGLFAGLEAPRSVAFNEEDLGDKPDWMQVYTSYGYGRTLQVDELYRDRLRSLLAVDDMIGQVDAALAEEGIRDETVVIFLSDNGYHFAEHRLFPGKVFAYEEDIRVPLIVRDPRVPGGRVAEELVLNIDLAPTIAELAGVRPPSFVDGRSMVPILEGRTPLHWRTSFLVERQEFEPAEYYGPPYRALRSTRYKYVEWADGQEELYDLEADPHETESLHGQVAPAVRDELRSLLQQLRECAGAVCRPELSALRPEDALGKRAGSGDQGPSSPDRTHAAPRSTTHADRPGSHRGKTSR